MVEPAPRVRVEPGSEPAAVERLLRGLPEWFGIESSVAEYVEAAGRLPTLLARPCDPDAPAVGALILQRHFPSSAEIHLMAVERSWHRRGIGRALLAAAEKAMRREQVALMSVKTLGPSHPDPAYEGTRRFYAAMGYLPVEELHGLWPGNPCMIMVKPLTAPR